MQTFAAGVSRKMFAGVRRTGQHFRADRDRLEHGHNIASDNLCHWKIRVEFEDTLQIFWRSETIIPEVG